ncbi:hypothetical protein DFR69_12233 [Nocardia neocaledoniensis]|uniref:F5/8 type C domain-containing protein n=2 Tax=Nocardia neocaledoniensis TaxID=236511 RepID=A0A317N0U2_9NOCA|nr:hypothetical protein DFR69_12233 [Nocardia neocaledoniensis]
MTVGAVVIVMLMLVMFMGGEEPDDASNDHLLVISPPAAATTTSTSTTAVASEIEVKSAQSKCPPGSTSGMDAFAGESGKAWSCVRAFKVDGQVLSIDLGTVREIDSIGIVPGWDSVSPDGEDQWSKYRTVSRVSYQFDDADTSLYTQQTMDQRTLVVTKFTPPIRASKIVLTVLESKGDSSLNTTAISAITIRGR